MQDVTVCFLLKGNPTEKILLGLKKTGVGKGLYNGFGGKVEVGETIAEAAVRELEEEVGIKLSQTSLQNMGYVIFPAHQWRMNIFVVNDWAGTPQESHEMKPIWFDINDLPLEQMWSSDREWLSMVLTGKRIQGTVTTRPNGDRICNLAVVN